MKLDRKVVGFSLLAAGMATAYGFYRYRQRQEKPSGRKRWDLTRQHTITIPTVSYVATQTDELPLPKPLPAEEPKIEAKPARSAKKQIQEPDKIMKASRTPVKKQTEEPVKTKPLKTPVKKHHCVKADL